jgi:hypothetical protein
MSLAGGGTCGLRERTEGRGCWPELLGITFGGDVGWAGGVDAGGVVGFCGETGPAPAVGVAVGVVGVVDFTGAAGAGGTAATVGATSGSGCRTAGALGVAGAIGGVAAAGVAALFCGSTEGRLAFRFRTPPPRLRMPPDIPGMTFCSGVGAVGSDDLCSAIGFGAIVISGVGDSVGVASAVGASGSAGSDS